MGAERLTAMASPRLALRGALRAPRRERNALETRRRILDAAEAEFASKGFDGARLGSIARAAEAQQALIHHYFEDKAGLYRAVLARALEALSGEGWEILANVRRSIPPPQSSPASSAPTGAASASTSAPTAVDCPSGVDLPALIDAFAVALLRFYSRNARILSILRHEAGDAGARGMLGDEGVRASVKPVFDAVVALIEDLRGRGEVRADVDGRHLCLSAVAMASWPFQEPHFMAMVSPLDVRDPRFLEERRRELVTTLLRRVR